MEHRLQPSVLLLAQFHPDSGSERFSSSNSFHGFFDSGICGLEQQGLGPARVCVWFSDRFGGVSLKKKEGRPASRGMTLT